MSEHTLPEAVGANPPSTQSETVVAPLPQPATPPALSPPVISGGDAPGADIPGTDPSAPSSNGIRAAIAPGAADRAGEDTPDAAGPAGAGPAGADGAPRRRRRGSRGGRNRKRPNAQGAT